MCGIAGIFTFRDATIDPTLLRRMMGQILHRGPDGTGLHVRENVGLAHARLSIIDLSGGHQPMSNADGSLWITFNGEIFNYVELREELVARGHRFRTRSDTETILHLYEDHGVDCVRVLNGQWAFAIWDATAGRLFLSRDRLGVRPLFYARTPDAFLFASEIKALLVHPGISREIDPRALDDLFTFLCVLPPKTAFRGVQQLPPAHSMIVDRQGITLLRHWQMTFRSPATSGPLARRTEERHAEELVSLLSDATRIRLRSDVPVGAYLSGGLDSTITTALAKTYVSRALRTFSIAFEDEAFDESPYQREVAAFLGTRHYELRCSGHQIGLAFPSVVWHAETPILWTAPAPLYLLSRAVRAEGYKVVLTGEGSDEFFGGYDIFKEAKIRRFCAAQPASDRRAALLGRAYSYLRDRQVQSAAYLRALFAVGPDDSASPYLSHLPRWRLLAPLKRLLFSPAVQAELRTYDGYHDLAALLPDGFADLDWLSRAQCLEAINNLSGYLLSSQGDRVAMAHGVEGRFPFLDHRVVEFASHLPARLKLRALDEKYLLKRATRHLVPTAVIGRRKQSYRAPLGRAFMERRGRTEPIEMDYVRENLSRHRVTADGLFDAKAVECLVAKVVRHDARGIRDNWAFVGVLSTQLLVDQFVRAKEARAYDGAA